MPNFRTGPVRTVVRETSAPGSGQGRDADIIDAGILDQIPTLIICGRTGIGQHERHRFGQVQGAAAADPDQGIRHAV